MKNFTLSLLMMMFTICGFAQLAQETFETWPVNNSGGVTTWKTFNDVTAAPQSTVVWAQSSGAGDFVGYNSPHAAIMQRENLPSPPNNAPIDWLITPQFTVPQNPILRFYTKLIQGGDQSNRFDIRISENADQMALGNYTSLIDATQTFPWGENDLMEGGGHQTYIQKIVTIPTQYINKPCYIAFVMRGTVSNADRWLVDNVSVDTRCAKPETLGTNSPTTQTITLTWTNPSGATNQEIQVVPAAGSPAPTGTPVSATTSYLWTGLAADTDYKFYIRSMCSPTNPSEWAGPFSFSTVPLGARCAEPLPINTLPFSTNNTTANFGDFVDGIPGAGCTGGSTSLNGNEVIYAYTATFTGLININLSNTGANSVMYVYTNCNNIGNNCVAGGTGNASTPINLNNFSVTTGQTYYIVIATSGSTQTTPYTLIVQGASCTPPATPSVANIGPHSADISWTSIAGITSWEIVVQPAGTGIPPGTGTQTNINTNYPATGLLEATPYEYWIRADCNNSTFSAWAGPFLFTTTQVPAIINYTQDFESDNTGFTFVNGTQTNKWVHGTAVSNGGAKSLYVSNDNGTSNAYTITTASTVQVYRDVQIPAGANEISVSFDWRALGETNATGTTKYDYFRVWLVPTTFTPVAGTQVTALVNERIKLGGEYNDNGNWINSEYTQGVSAYAGQVRRIVIEWRNDGSGGTQPPAAIDNLNIKLVTCSRPSGLTATNQTQNSVNLAWVAPPTGAESYDYYYSTSNVPPTDATPQNGNTTLLTATPNDLTEATTYYVWIRSVCSGTNGKSLWFGPVSFTTTQIPAIINYSQDFEAANSGFTFLNGTQPNKWVVGSATSNGGTKSLYVSNDNGVTNGYTSGTSSVVHAYRDIQIPSPVNEISVSFDWKTLGDASDNFRVWLVPTNFTPTPGTQITALVNERIKLGPDYFNSEAWVNGEFTINVSQYAGQVRRLVIEWRNNASGNFAPPAAIDNLNIKIVTCSRPANLTATNATPSSVNLAWAAPASGAESYDYYYSTSSTPPTDATVQNGNTASLNATPNDLEQSTVYYVWVRSVCSGTNGKSLWLGPVSFTTPQIPAILNYAQNFEDANTNFSFVGGTAVNKWYVGNATSNGGTRSLYISNNNGTANAYTTTTSVGAVFAYRDFQLPPATPFNQIEVSFDWKANGEGTSTLYDYMRVWIVPVDYVPVAGTPITAGTGRQQLGTSYNLNGNWITVSHTVSYAGYEGQARRLVFEWRNDGSGGTQPPAAVDNLNISVVTCKKPTTLSAPAASITTTTAVLNWVEAGTATNWFVYITPVGEPGPTFDTPGTAVPGTAPTYNAADLAAGTAHYFYVRADCGGAGLSGWAGPLLFVTKPSNDECNTALVVPVNPDSLCNQTVLGTVGGATASADPNTCSPAADDDDVWFEFTPTANTQHYIALLDVQGANGLRVSDNDLVFAVYSGTCGNLTQVLCSAANNALLNNLVPNQTYKLRVYSASSAPQNFTFRVCIGVVYQCNTATRFCNEESGPAITFQGSVGIPSLGTRSCLITTPNPTFFELLVQQSGPMSFNITQTNINGQPIDVDFIAYGPFDGPSDSATGGCGSGLVPANQIACGYSTAAVENFNIPNAVAGKYYIIIITNFRGDRSTVSFSQTNTTAPGAGAPNCEGICDVNFGPDVTLCGATQHTLTATVFNALGYTWYFNDGTGEVVIPGATSATYIATQTGDYKVVVNKPSCATPPTDTIKITFGPAINLPAQVSTSVCGTGGTASVMLPSFNALALGTLNPADYTVEYYLTAGAAAAGTGAIDQTVAYNVSTQSLFVKVKSVIAPTCFDVVELAITVANTPTADIVYSGSPFCSNEATGTVTQTGNNGGVYTSATGLVIDPATGTIDIAASTPGTYTIAYTIAATATCPELIETTEITIFPAPTATIGYPSPLCSSGTTASVTLEGTAGGTYTTTAGLTVDPATGEINIAVSTPGTYDVTYTIPATADCASFSTQAQVVISQNLTAAIDYGNAPYCADGGIVNVVQTGTAGGNYTSTTGLYIDATTGDVNLGASTAGTYTVTYTIPASGGCSAVQATASITITAVPVATFSYAAATVCQNAANQAITLGAGATAGTFSADQPGLTIDPATGTVTPTTSTPGTYVVTNTVPAANGCTAVTASFNMTINLAPVATFSYVATPYCKNGLNPLPQLDGVAGTFSSTAGLVINAATGEVDLAQSAPGTYTVTNTIAGTTQCPAYDETATITVTAIPVATTVQGCDGNSYTVEVKFDGDAVYNKDNVSFTWVSPTGSTLDATGHKVVVTEPGVYNVTITPDAAGLCSVILPVTVTDTTCMVQRGISPNNDGLNDSFDLTALSVTKLSIFNRYGQEVFTYGTYTNQWHGQGKGGDELPTGTYFYSFKRANGEEATGWVYINREEN